MTPTHRLNPEAPKQPLRVDGAGLRTGEMSMSASQHPRWILAVRTRTRLFGTLNVAIALRGTSSGWGTREKPRRTFIGRHRGKQPAYHRGIEVVFMNDPTRCGMSTSHRLVKHPARKWPDDVPVSAQGNPVTRHRPPQEPPKPSREGAGRVEES